MSGHPDIVEQAHDQSKGGAWKDDELESFTGWTGEAGTTQQVKTTVSHKPLTRSQEDNAILAALNIKDDEMAALTRQIERRMLRNAGRSATSVVASLTEENREREEKLKTWIAESSSHDSTRAAQNIEALERQVSSLADKVTVLEKQLDELLTSQLERTEAETRMIQEAYNVIITNQRAEADTADTPSEAHRMEEHVENLKSRSMRLAQMATNVPGTVKLAQQGDRRKKKFGTL